MRINVYICLALCEIIVNQNDGVWRGTPAEADESIWNSIFF